MAGSRRDSEPNIRSAVYEPNPGPTAMPPATPVYPADRQRETETRRTVAAARARQRSA
jgi:hypothetical protein